MRICAYSECNKEFIPKTHNQRYDCSDCCRLATNAEIMRKYYERKARKSGAVRLCDCGNQLSRYNETKVCQKCQAIRDKKQRMKLLGMVGYDPTK